VADAVLPTDPVEQDLTATWSEAPGEDLSVVAQDLGGNAVGAHGQGQCVTRWPGRGPRDDEGGDAEPGVVVDAVTILASVPSAKHTPPTMSICHSFIARDRSQRL